MDLPINRMKQSTRHPKKKKRPGLFLFVLILFILLNLSACAHKFESDDYVFLAPAGFSTTQVVEGNNNNNTGDQFVRLIFSKGPDISFWVSRVKKPSGSDLVDVFNSYRNENEKKAIDLNYQFIAQNHIEQNGQTAIEYIYRQFSGEWYWQRREVWLENNGMIYALVCSEPVETTPGKDIPVSATCLQIMEGFKVKNE